MSGPLKKLLGILLFAVLGWIAASAAHAIFDDAPFEPWPNDFFGFAFFGFLLLFALIDYVPGMRREARRG